MSDKQIYPPTLHAIFVCIILTHTNIYKERVARVACQVWSAKEITLVMVMAYGKLPEKEVYAQNYTLFLS